MYLETSKNCMYKSCCIVDLLRQKGNSNNCLGKGEIITKNLENFTLLFPSHTYNHKTFNNFCDRVAKVFRNFRGRRREQRSRFIEEFGCISWEKLSSEQKSRHETMGTCGQCGMLQLDTASGSAKPKTPAASPNANRNVIRIPEAATPNSCARDIALQYRRRFNQTLKSKFPRQKLTTTDKQQVLKEAKQTVENCWKDSSITR